MKGDQNYKLLSLMEKVKLSLDERSIDSGEKANKTYGVLVGILSNITLGELAFIGVMISLEGSDINSIFFVALGLLMLSLLALIASLLMLYEGQVVTSEQCSKMMYRAKNIIGDFKKNDRIMEQNQINSLSKKVRALNDKVQELNQPYSFQLWGNSSRILFFISLLFWLTGTIALYFSLVLFFDIFSSFDFPIPLSRN